MATSSNAPVAVVTGSTEGIGLATARAFGAVGYAVVVNGRGAERTQEVVDELSAEGIDTTGVPGDVRDEEVAQALTSTHDRLDVIVNNAGISPKRDGQSIPILDMTRDEWDLVMDVNLNSAWYLAVLAGRRMREQASGVILFMSSVTGRTYAPTSAHYTTSKTALIGLTRAMAGELATTGIRVCGIAPGRIQTRLTATWDPELAARVDATIPMARAGTPEEVADTAVFLASPAASYLTGITLDVNGGSWMT